MDLVISFSTHLDLHTAISFSLFIKTYFPRSIIERVTLFDHALTGLVFQSKKALISLMIKAAD